MILTTLEFTQFNIRLVIDSYDAQIRVDIITLLYKPNSRNYKSTALH